MKLTSFGSSKAFRVWLEKHHYAADELLVRCYRLHAKHRGLTYREALDEALCFGWIDGVRRTNRVCGKSRIKLQAVFLRGEAEAAGSGSAETVPRRSTSLAILSGPGTLVSAYLHLRKRRLDALITSCAKGQPVKPPSTAGPRRS